MRDSLESVVLLDEETSGERRSHSESGSGRPDCNPPMGVGW